MRVSCVDLSLRERKSHLWLVAPFSLFIRVWIHLRLKITEDPDPNVRPELHVSA